MRKGYLLLASITIALTTTIAGCVSGPPQATFVDGQERMPAPASLYLTTDPAIPTAPVTVVMTEPEDPDFNRTHTFPAGVEQHGVYPTSSGRYRLTAMDGACAVDVFLAPDLDTDIVLHLLEGGSCGFAIIRSHGDDGSHDGPNAGFDVLVAPGGVPEPSTTGGASAPSP